MNLPNRITVGRLLLALIFFAFFRFASLADAPEWWKPAVAGGIFVLAVATDALDGYYARKLGLQTDFGRIADPVVDKIIVAGGLIFLTATSWAAEFVPVWMVVLIIAREFMVSGLRGFIEARGVAFPSRWDGKLKMILQCVAIPAVFLHRMVDLGWPAEKWKWIAKVVEWFSVITVWATFVLTMTSGFSYVREAARVLRRQSDSPRSA
ncbi:MAG TPA: CDP-diacylglycerol--glycerol-3-phosphate 3-phosphatidyltransferase [Planctomycetota bacterium]|nr:CDP-diacylglycerol--glycerol-3-phosphate 3-phosphatidyltransferase [Planctomycetota bacterium]